MKLAHHRQPRPTAAGQIAAGGVDLDALRVLAAQLQVAAEYGGLRGRYANQQILRHAGGERFTQQTKHDRYGQGVGKKLTKPGVHFSSLRGRGADYRGGGGGISNLKFEI